MKIFLFIIDCLRDDYITKKTTPNICNIQKNGFKFDTCIASAPYTTCSFASLLSGLNPYNHGLRHLSQYYLKKPTLVSKFKQLGLITAAFFSAFVLESKFKKEFDYCYDDVNTGYILGRGGWVPCWIVDERVDRFLTQNKDNFFIVIHYFDAHWPYKSPDMKKAEYNGYKDAMSCLDRHIGSYFKNFKDSIFIITADHGEGLGEKERDHRQFLYDVTLKVPLIFYNLPAPDNYIDSMVRHIDVLPTILCHCGIETDVDGISLYRSNDDLIAYSETSPTKKGIKYISLRNKEYKVIYDLDTKEYEVYDLIKDLKEENNIAQRENYLKDKLEEMLKKDIIGVKGHRYGEEFNTEQQKKIEKKLQNLGYF